MRPIEVTAVILGDVIRSRPPKLAKESNLALNVFYIVIRSVKVDNLERNDVPSGYMNSAVYGSISTFPYNFKFPVKLRKREKEVCVCVCVVIMKFK